MANIAVFYHVYQYGDWINVFREQEKLIVDSSLEDRSNFIHLGINGNQNIDVREKFNLVFNEEPWSEETPTLLSLREFAIQNPGWNILYLHTKGVTCPMNSTRDWRNVMGHFCVERWKDCVEKLKSHDAVGCLYMDHCYYGYFPHFSGNFWWATSDYISRLDNSYLTGGIRQNREFWIGSGGGSLYSFHTTNLNHYAHEYPRHLYAS
jgi:hypothetical protein